jgi:serine/threonine-protein kinase RsbT
LIQILDAVDIVRARSAARAMAAAIGFGLADQTRIATAVSELARNAMQYAGGGVCELFNLSSEAEHRIKIVIEDQGPGIADITKALSDGYSTSSGLGAGLPGSRRLMDEFSIESRPGLTRIQMQMIRRCA